MIQTKDLTFSYAGSNQLSFPDLVVESGKALVICGESGCGKTTLLHLLAGLMRPISGTIHIHNEEISLFSTKKMDQFRGRHIGMVYQQPYFIQSLSILDNLLLSPYARSLKKARAVATRLHIEDVLLRYPDQLSVGQKQRATIARAVMNQPKILLADEPTSALDNKNCTKVIDLLKEEAKANNAALIIATHDNRLRAEVNDYIDLNQLNSM